jgi:hypothetical protein
VTVTGEDDTLELRHDARNRRGFALGAVRGAEWLAGKTVRGTSTRSSGSCRGCSLRLSLTGYNLVS